MFKKRSSLTIAITISILIHLVFVYAVISIGGQEQAVHKPKSKVKPIQATLWFEKPKQIELPEPPPPVIEKEETKPDNIVEKTEPAAELAQATPKAIAEITPPTTEEKPTPIKEGEASQLKQEPKSLFTTKAKQHLQQYQQQRDEIVIEQAARYYQQHKNSPVIDAKPEDPFVTEEEKLMQSILIKTDCSNTKKKALATVLSLLGGAVTCSKPPPISGFIQKRISKEHLLPTQAKVKDRTQSVVIK